MPSVPGYCARCDLVFDGGGGIHIENSANVTLGGNTMTCPNCGRPAKLIEGVFNFREDQIELVSGPPLTVEILKRLRDITERARAREITPAAAIREAKELDPVLGGLLGRYLELGVTALTAFLALISVYMDYLGLEAQRVGNELQRESLEIQQRDSTASEAFYSEALKLLAEQASTLEQATAPKFKSVSPSPHKAVVGKGDRRAKPKATKKTVAAKAKSKRRAEVRKQRRIELRERRRMFPNRSHSPQS